MAAGLTASPATAQPTLTTSPNPSIYNQSVRLQAVVSDVTAPTGTMTFRETGVVVPLGSAAVATARYIKVVAGGSNMCGIVSDTTLECWGYNVVGQLGDGTISAGATTPAQVPGLIGVTDVEVGNDHVCAVMSDTSVKCWGNNVYGQVGNTTGGQILSPTTVSGLSNVTTVALGTGFSCAVKSDATVVCWGRNNLGQLGIGNTTDTNAPTAIAGLTNVTAITAGYESACALKSDGTVSCWGSNQYGQLGAGDTTNSTSPRSVLNLSTAVTISAGGGYQVCALLADATAQCWGRNDYGQLGTGTAGANQSTPQTVSGLANVTNISSGNGWSCAALASGNPRCWGFNYSGTLAQGFRDGINTPQPTPLDTPAYAGAVYFALGGGGGCAILANDTIVCAGENYRGQLGNGGTTDAVVTPTNVVKTFTKSVAVINQAFTAGNHTLTADFTPTVGGTTTSADVVQVVNKATQTITFPALANTAFSATAPTPAATASSGLAVSYSSSTQGVCTVTTGGTMTFDSVGTCSITASQTGDDNREAATPVTQSFSVTPGSQTITFPALADRAFTATPPVPAATASSNLTVSYGTTTSAVCTVTGGGTITFQSVGICTISATQAGNTNFNAATTVTKSFTITPGVNTITFPALPNTAFSATPPAPAATASSNLAVSYTSATTGVCTAIPTGTITFVSAGTRSIIASQAGNTNFAAATPVTKSFSVTPGANTITFPALPNTAFDATPPVPAATASSNLAVSYASTTAPVCTATATGRITFVSAGTCSIAASQAGNASFAPAVPVTRSFTVLRAVRVVVTSSNAVSEYGSPVTFTATVTAPSGVAPSGRVIFRDGGTLLGTAVLSGGRAKLTTAAFSVGAHAIQVTYGGSPIDAPAVSTRIRQTVTKATPSVSLSVQPNPVAAGQVATMQVSVRASRNAAKVPTGRVAFRDGATVIGTTTLVGGRATFRTSALAVGGHAITARYEGDPRYRAIVSSPVLLNVERSCNDFFARATLLEGTTGAATGSTKDATGEPGERPPPFDQGSIHSVWCKWTASAPGLAVFDTTGSLFDTTLSVYTGTSVRNLKMIAGNDNADFGSKNSMVVFRTARSQTYYIRIDGAGNARGTYVLNWVHRCCDTMISAAVLPGARSVPVGSTMTVAASIRNEGQTPATRCGVALPKGFPAKLSFQAATTQSLPAPAQDVPVSIAPGSSRQFTLRILPTKVMHAAEVPLVFSCANTGPAAAVTGLNRLIMSAAAAPTSDVSVAASTASRDGIVTIQAVKPGVFVARSQNIGASETLTVSAVMGERNLPLSVSLCRNDPTTGTCMSGSKPTPSVRVAYGVNQVETFTVFVKATGAIPLDPVQNRIQLRWKSDDGLTKGISSVAVKTQ